MTTQRDARKQLLLTRIAFERNTLRGDLLRVRKATSVTRLLRGALPESVGQALFGASKLPVNWAGWLALGLGLMRRYRTATTVLGGLVPGLRVRSGLRRARHVGIVVALGAGAWFAWRVFGRR